MERRKHTMGRRVFALIAVAALILAGCGGSGSGTGLTPPYIIYFTPVELTWTTADAADSTRSLDFYIRQMPAGDATLRLYDGEGNQVTFGPDRIKPPAGNSADLEAAIKKSDIPAVWANTTVSLELKIAGQVIPQVITHTLRIQRP